MDKDNFVIRDMEVSFDGLFLMYKIMYNVLSHTHITGWDWINFVYWGGMNNIDLGVVVVKRGSTAKETVSSCFWDFSSTIPADVG